MASRGASGCVSQIDVLTPSRSETSRARVGAVVVASSPCEAAPTPTALTAHGIEVDDHRAIPFFLKSPFANVADWPFGIVSVFQTGPAKWRAR